MPIKPEKEFHENRHEKRLSRARCFFLHPWFVALAWRKLCGFPLAAFSNSTPTNLPLGATA
jgi:hypothetical protein